MKKDTYIKGVSFKIHKPKVFIEAFVVSADPRRYEGLGLICIEAPALRSLCCDLSSDMDQHLNKPGKRWLDARTKQLFRQTLECKCRIWHAATDQWSDSKVQVKHRDPGAADCSETEAVLVSTVNEPRFESFPLSDNLMFSLQLHAQEAKSGIVHIREGFTAELDGEDQALYALHDALRKRLAGKFTD